MLATLELKVIGNDASAYHFVDVMLTTPGDVEVERSVGAVAYVYR